MITGIDDPIYLILQAMDQKLCGRRGRLDRGIGHMVSHREVTLMPDSGNDRQTEVRYILTEPVVVKCGQIDGTSTTS